MTKEQAEYVKDLRCSGATYRAIARNYVRKYPEHPNDPENHFEGEWLVVEASLILVESDKTWDNAGLEAFPQRGPE